MTEVDRQDIKALLSGFPRERTYLLPALHAVQKEVRWIPAWAMEEVSAHLRVPKSEVHGVASSFPELRMEAPGQHVLRVCTGLPCYLKRAPSILDEAREALGLRPGETATDGEITLEESPCLFICSMAPAVELDGVPMGRMTPERLAARVNETIHRGRGTP